MTLYVVPQIFSLYKTLKSREHLLSLIHAKDNLQNQERRRVYLGKLSEAAASLLLMRKRYHSKETWNIKQSSKIY